MRRGLSFTLIEMLVVIAIIGVLAALLSGPLMNARKDASKMACTNTLSQIGKATFQYESPSYYDRAPIAGNDTAATGTNAATVGNWKSTISPLIALRRGDLIDNIGMVVCPVGSAPQVERDDDQAVSLNAYSEDDDLGDWATGVVDGKAVSNYSFTLNYRKGSRGNRVIAADTSSVGGSGSPDSVAGTGVVTGTADTNFTPNHGDDDGVEGVPIEGRTGPTDGGNGLFGDGHVEASERDSLLFDGARDKNNPWGVGAQTLLVDSKDEDADSTRQLGEVKTSQTLIGGY